MARRALVAFLGLTLLAACGAPYAAAPSARSAQGEGSRCDATALAELEAVRQAKGAADLAAALRAERAIAARRQTDRPREIARLFAEVEVDAEQRIAAAERLSAAVAPEMVAASRALAELDRTCASRRIASAMTKKPPRAPVKDEVRCERLAQITSGITWSDARSIGALADDLERLAPPQEPTAHRAAVAAARRLVTKLRASAADRAILDAPREAAARAERAASGVLGACAPLSRTLLVVAKDPDPRSLTVVVVAKPPAELAAQLEEAARQTQEQDLASFYRGVASGRLGSGFALVGAGEGGARETWVVTNRHVVDLAESVGLVLGDGSKLDATTVYIDPTYDLAVVSPKDRGKKLAPQGGFDVATRAAKDGEAVSATGYPALVGAPSFQFTRGHVSNEGLIFPDGTNLPHVQHTAAIDPGSSGGPLLGPSREVLGVNTFKLIGRENVNIAVPADAVARVIEAAKAARRCEGSCRAAAARDACLSLASELTRAEPRLAALQRMLGRDLVAVHGIESHDAILPHDAEIFTRFQASPMATLSEAVARTIAADVGAAGGVHPLEACAGVRASANQASATLLLADGTTRAIGLRWEFSRWVLAEYDLPEPVIVPLAPPAPKKKDGRR